MGISFAITAYNEHEELKRLLEQLIQVVNSSDEIVIQLDTKATQEVIELVDEFLQKNLDKITIKKTFFDLNKDFASFKNNLKKVHEKIVGWKTYAELPSEDDSYALYHIKDIDRQRAQNSFYSTL